MVFDTRVSRRTSFRLAFSALGMKYLPAAAPVPDMTRAIPPRDPQALTGSQFAQSVLGMDRHEREGAILDQLMDGNLPAFLRNLTAVKLTRDWPEGKTLAATIFIMPEYLAIGSDRDFLRIPMNLHTAAAIANVFGFVLPTKRIVDAVYDQARCHFMPQPLPPGPQMSSTEYYRLHNAMVEAQSKTRGFPAGVLVSGHKKDVVITNRLATHPGQIAIYGWHRGPGDPIQPLSTVHGAGYADYSHGIRLVAGMATIDGQWRPIREVLSDASLASVLSDEGPIRVSPS